MTASLPLQAVDHPYLVVYSTSGANAAAAQRALAATASASEAPAGAEEDVLNGGMCGVCHDPLEQPVVAGCGHAFCRVCARCTSTVHEWLSKDIVRLGVGGLMSRAGTMLL